MTLVVARSDNGRLAIAADTMITEHGSSLPMHNWALKTFCLPGSVCVSYSGSPELAAEAFQTFRKAYPGGANYSEAVHFFEASSTKTNNDYIVAFAPTAKLVTIRNGRRTDVASKTHWIGDANAYALFRRYERERGRQYEHGQAVNAALFADEMAGSPASDLYSVMRNLVFSREVPSVGGFVTVVSNRDIGFRFSVYTDVLLDWPIELDENQTLQLTDKIVLRASGENDRYSVSQISPGYYNMNAVAFYVLKGRLLVAFCEVEGAATRCVAFQDIQPDQIAQTLSERLGFPFHAMCLVMSAPEALAVTVGRSNPNHGLGIRLYCELNTMPKASAAS